jgi:Protein of unknown function (DUF2793)
MSLTSDRFQLPLLAVGQAQKEVTHNEALALIDALITPVVQAVAPASVPTSPIAGQGWIVGASPTGAWEGQAGKLAFWTSGGWRFVSPQEGMTVWSIADSLSVRCTAAAWEIGAAMVSSVRIGGNQVIGARLAAIPSPVGGTTTDAEARAAIDAILARMRDHGLIAA